MRVLMNGISLLAPRGGIGAYIYYLSQYLQSVSNEVEIAYFYGRYFSSQLKENGEASYRNLVKAAQHSRYLSQALHRLKELLFRMRCPSNIDVYHETNYIPMPFHGSTVVTVFDLSLHLWPQTHPESRRKYFERCFYKRLPWASHFITISEATKAEMVQHLNISPEKITVTHLGVNPTIRNISQEAAQGILARYGLTYGSYILYVGTLEPRKNVPVLLQAYALLSQAIQKRIPLVLAGGKGWMMGDLEEDLKHLSIASTTLVTDFVSIDDLPALYSGAAVFVYPSLYEGFGLPPLEAMACGTPVITSNVSSLPEVVGDAGILVDPQDVKRLKDEIEHVLEDTSYHSALSQRGLERSKHFTWEKCARETMGVYSQVSCLAGRHLQKTNKEE